MARKILKEFQITEISAVDEPAQEGARALLMKRADPADPHANPKLAAKGANPMPQTPEEMAKALADAEAKLTKQAEEHAAALAKAQAEAAEASAIAKMTDDEKKMLDEMKDEKAKKNFIALSPEARAAEVQKARAARAESDPVIYKSAAGREYRKSQAELAELAKQADENARELAKARQTAEDATISKRVSEEFGSFPDPKAAGALLKSAEAIEDGEVKKGALALLKSAHAALGKLTKMSGHRGGEGEADLAKAATEFSAKVQDIRKRDGIGHQAAMAKARDEFPDLFKAYQGEGSGTA